MLATAGLSAGCCRVAEMPLARSCHGLRRAAKASLIAAVLLGGASGLGAWKAGADERSPIDSTLTTLQPAAYQFPSARRQFRAWAWNAVGPSAIGGNLVGAGWRQWVTEEPAEWGGGRQGFAKRFGAGCLTTGVGETSLSLLSALMRQDPAYYRSPRTGVRARSAHALLMSFMARAPSGDAVFSPAKTLSAFAGPLVTQTTVYPDRYDYRTALASGAYGLLINAGWNLLREFVVRSPGWGGGRLPATPRWLAAKPVSPEDPRSGDSLDRP